MTDERPPVTSDALPIGTLLHGDSYAIEEVLGQGGFGFTYRAQDPRLNRTVAIKELFPVGSRRLGLSVQPHGSLTGDEYGALRERFLGEARRLAQFDDPSIVRVHAWFETNNSAYTVMEFIRGHSLRTLLAERGALPEEDAVDFIARTGRALELVHAAGLLHRDIKPDNIMLADDGRVVLIDFGTARPFVPGKTGYMTAELTTAYAPLEQYVSAARFGPFTDIYALGATLYHLLVGRLPPSAMERAAGSELIAVRQLRPEVSSPTDAAVMWALQMRVDQRPQSVGALLDALPATGSPAPPDEPVAAGQSGATRLGVLVAVVAAGLLLGVTAYALLVPRLEEAATVPVQPAVANASTASKVPDQRTATNATAPSEPPTAVPPMPTATSIPGIATEPTPAVPVDQQPGVPAQAPTLPPTPSRTTAAATPTATVVRAATATIAARSATPTPAPPVTATPVRPLPVGLQIREPTNGARVSPRTLVRGMSGRPVPRGTHVWLFVKAQAPGSRWYPCPQEVIVRADGTWDCTVDLGGPAGLTHEIMVGVVYDPVHQWLVRYVAEHPGQPLYPDVPTAALPRDFLEESRVTVTRQ